MNEKYIDLTQSSDNIPNINYTHDDGTPYTKFETELQKTFDANIDNDDAWDSNIIWIDSNSTGYSMDSYGSDSNDDVCWDVNSVPTIDMLWSNDNDF